LELLQWQRYFIGFHWYPWRLRLAVVIETITQAGRRGLVMDHGFANTLINIDIWQIREHHDAIIESAIEEFTLQLQEDTDPSEEREGRVA
jgi:hypothetical protein